MVDLPERSEYEPDDRAPAKEEGWGSPLPAEYGSLRAVRPPSGGRPAQPSRPPRTESHRPPRSNAAERWAGTSLLRRLQGEAEPSQPSGAPGARSGADPPPRPAAAPAALAAPTTRRWNLFSRSDPEPLAPESGRRRTDRVIAAGAVAAAANAQFADTTAAPAVRAVGLATADEELEGPGPLGPDRMPPEIALVDRRRRRRPDRVRSTATIRHLDLMAVIRVSLVFWLVMLIAVVVASVLLYEAADIFGSLPSIEKSIRTLFSLKSFTLHPDVIAGYTALGGLVVSVAGTLATVVFALIYNLIADVVGGIRVELESSARD